MLKKLYKNTKSGPVCRVTFTLPGDVHAKTAFLLGDFNDWDPTVHPMKQLKDGSYSITVTLIAGKTYRFRYLLDGQRWENDWAADHYLPNDYGGEDSIIDT